MRGGWVLIGWVMIIWVDRMGYERRVGYDNMS